MRRALASTPPARAGEPAADGPVRRRLVFFCPGYDPEARTRYRTLFVREFIRHGKRFGLAQRDIGPVDDQPGLPGPRWTVVAGTDRWTTEAVIHVLDWSDIVRRDFRRPLPLVLATLFGGLAASMATGTLARFVRLSPKFAGVILYPALSSATALILCACVGLLVDAHIAAVLPASALGRVALVLGVAGLCFAALYPLLERGFVWHLARDWAFSFAHGMGWRSDVEKRVAQFAAHVSAAMRECDADEILVVGHSSGATLSVSVAAEALRRAPGASLSGRPRLALLTVGSCVPILALNPFARRYREDVRMLMAEPNLYWAEYQAPQDWLNFPGFDPALDASLSLASAERWNPVIRSARFKEIVAEPTYGRLLFRPLRMHFQFLMCNDRAGEYDYLMVLAGPLTLGDRVRLGDASVGCVLRTLPTAHEPPTEELAAAEAERRIDF